MPESTREQLTSGRSRDGVEFPAHLESYIAHALRGRVLSIGSGFSLPVLGVAHTFWISGVVKKLCTSSGQPTVAACTHPYVRVVSDTAIRILRSGPKETLEETSTIEKTDVLDRVLVDDGAYNNIGGLDTQLDTIRSMIELPLHSPSIFTDVGLQPPKGVLMYGPPGTGRDHDRACCGQELRCHVPLYQRCGAPEQCSRRV